MPENMVPQVDIDPTVVLRDGRVVVMREINGLDEHEVEQMFVKAKIRPEGFGQMFYVKVLMLTAIESIAGVPQVPPTDLAEAKMRLADFKSKDMARLLKLYAKLNADTDTDEGKDGSSPE